MASEWQTRANRANAALSTGPKSEAGKEKSSQNAVTHGFYATKVDDRKDDPKFRAERDAWIETFGPDNATTHELAATAFLNLKRMKRLYDIEDAAIAVNIAASVDEFDLERNAALDQAEVELLEKPFASQLALTATADGCDRLLLILEGIRAKFLAGIWTDECLRLLLAMRGRGGRGTYEPLLEAASDFVIRHQKPFAPRDKTLDTLDESLGVDLEPEAPEPDLCLSERDEARMVKAWEILIDRIETEREDLEGIRASLVENDEEAKSRRMFMIRSQFDDSPRGRSLMRCVTHANRAFQKSFDAAMRSTGVDLSKVSGPIPSKSAPPAAAPRPAAPPPPAPVPTSTPVAVKPSLVSRNEPMGNLAGRADLADLDAPLNFAVGRPPVPSASPPR